VTGASLTFHFQWVHRGSKDAQAEGWYGSKTPTYHIRSASGVFVKMGCLKTSRRSGSSEDTGRRVASAATMPNGFGGRRTRELSHRAVIAVSKATAVGGILFALVASFRLLSDEVD
jgi:hypothetical protein